MAVAARRQPEVAVLFRIITGLHHGAQTEPVDKENLFRPQIVSVARRVQEARQPVRALHGFCGRGQRQFQPCGIQPACQFFQLFRGRSGVHAVQERDLPFREEAGHGFVGRDHERFNEAVTEQAFAVADSRPPAVFHAELRFRQIEIQSSGAMAFSDQQPGQLRCVLQHGGEFRRGKRRRNFAGTGRGQP